jgi:autotransporter passenger strand-loop-strand repeat protein
MAATVSGNQYVLAGQVSTGLEILHNGQLFVSSGGTAIDTTVDSGGMTASGYFNPGSLYVYSGGVARATKLRGTETVLGLESGGTILASGNMTVNGTAVGVTISGAGIIPGPNPPPSTFIGPPTLANTGEMIVYGVASGTVLKGGLEIVESRDSGTIVSSGGWQYVAGSAIATTVSSGGEQEVVGGGITSGLTISSGGLQYLAGFAVSTTIDGGTQIVTGNGRSIGYASGTLVENGGSQVVSNEAVANLTFVGSGGNLYVESAGVAGATTLSGGTEFVSSGGDAFTTTINSGGTQIVSSGGFAGEEGPGGIQGSTTILAGGVQQISGGGFASNTTINGGTQYVSRLRRQSRDLLTSTLEKQTSRRFCSRGELIRSPWSRAALISGRRSCSWTAPRRQH